MTILDTNVVSETMASSPSRAVLSWIARRRAADELFTTAITVAEILYGIELLPHGKKRNKLNSEAEAMFAEDFAGRILQFDEQAARVFAHIASSRRKSGRPIAAFDAQIAAIADVRGAAVATGNTGDFEGCGIRLVNPWVD
ncbi:MAG: type II toxin-antitoxin system VapC family toxin [Acidobacteria bacterium]|nr:type II toxin-antitoxin system VapC family toxin [Acidobacteriota bacterium]